MLWIFFECATAALGGDDEGPVFDERPFVAELFDVFPGGALAGFAAAGDGVRARGIETDSVAGVHFRKVWPDVVEVFAGHICGSRSGNVGGFDQHDDVPGKDGIADGHGESLHAPAHFGGDDVLHLHRLHHEQLLAGTDEVAFADVNPNDGALQGCANGVHAWRQVLKFGSRSC